MARRALFRRAMRKLRIGAAPVALMAVAIAGCGGGGSSHPRVANVGGGPPNQLPVADGGDHPGAAWPTVAATAHTGIHKIRHVVVIMQENRSFDSYFGTYPGADGIPMKRGVPTVCVLDPLTGVCQRPYHNPSDKNFGGPHGQRSSVKHIAGGRMDGFIGQAELQRSCLNVNDPNCAQRAKPDVMGWHDAREIPNYWTYAHDFVLQDRMFEPNASWSLPAHLFMVSGWSAQCHRRGDPSSCANALQNPGEPPDQALTRLRRRARLLGLPGAAAVPPGAKVGVPAPPDYAWTDLTYLLHAHGVSWGYYVFPGQQPDCQDDAMFCRQGPQNAHTPGIWNPLPFFDTVHQDGQINNIQPLQSFYTAARAGTLPAVSWIDPSGQVSEHPPALISAGLSYVTGLVNAIMRSPNWSSTAIFLAWDDWGGFYDHVAPPFVDGNGYGVRCPGSSSAPTPDAA